MKKITTESGAIYHYDEENSRVMREGPNSPGIDYESTPDDEWLAAVGATGLEPGQSAYFALRGARYRVTTPILSIEEVES